MSSHELDAMYVAPSEPPPARKPPVREVGAVKWLRDNLFSSPLDSIITVVTALVIGSVLYSILDWALFEAQWEIVFLNLRALNVGTQYPIDAVWRAQIVALIVVFLGMLSVGVWGRFPRWMTIAVISIAVMMVVVPAATQGVPEPPVFTYLDPRYSIRQVNFIAQAGQELTFTIEPLTSPDDFRVETLRGYIENDNRAANTAFDSFSAASAEILLTQQRDPSTYDLNVALQVWDKDGNVIVQSPFSEGTTENTSMTWTAPYSGWFTFTAVRHEENPGEAGIAWLRVDNLEVMRSTVSAAQERLALYGEAPDLDCSGCATQVYRTDLRFQGRRTLTEWFSLQLAPFLLETRPLFFASLLVGVLGYTAGMAVKQRRLPFILLPSKQERYVALFTALMFSVYILMQFFGLTGGNPNQSTLYLIILGVFCLSVIFYALLQLRKGTPAGTSLGVGLLWAISFPIILTLINGVAGVPQMQQIPSDEQGGLLLTLLLSAIAIIASFPIGLLLALGRQSKLPVVSLFCTLFIEVVRGVPLITLLFLGRLILPFFGFGLGDVDLLIRIAVVLTLFTSAYLAEVIRGGLQTIPRGQYEAAHALGLNDFYTNTFIILPQALRTVIPAIMGQAVSLFKDTSLVYVVNLYELVGVMNVILGDSQTGYLMFPREGYLFVGIVYFVFSYIMAEASRRLEKTGAGAVRRETI
jgi:His/Glu/Gln/Arg/opine family amino acid ABC transporter permease subunit